MSVIENSHIQQLTDSLQKQWGGSAADYQILGPLQQRLYSSIYKVTSKRLPYSLVAKFCLNTKNNTPDCTSAKEQYEALQKIAGSLQQPEYGISQPVALFADIGLILMQWINASSLTRVLCWNVPQETQLDALQRAGIWLACFHQAGPISPGTFDWEHKKNQAQALTKIVFDDEVFMNAADNLYTAADQLINISVQCSWIHGDCKADNLMITQNCVTGIDVALRDINAIEYDVAQFLNHLTLLIYAPQRLMWLRQIWPGHKNMHIFEQAFLQGYQQQKGQISDFILAWVRLFLLISLWQSTCEKQPHTLRSRILNRLFRKVTRQLNQELNIQSSKLTS